MSNHRLTWTQQNSAGSNVNKTNILFVLLKRKSLGILLIAIGVIFTLVGFFHSSHAIESTAYAETPTKLETAQTNTAREAAFATSLSGDGQTSNFETIQTYLDELGAKQSNTSWSVVIQNVDEPSERATLHETNALYLASLYKLLLLKPLMHKLPDSAWQSTTVPNTGRNVTDCVSAMIRVSDNTCGEALGDYLGWTTIQKTARQDGLQSVSLKSSDFSASAEDVALLLRQLYQSEPSIAKETYMAAMHAQRYNKGIVKNCSGCSTYTKTGELLDVRHDVGIIERDGKAYVIVIMTKGPATWPQIADVSGTIEQLLAHVQ